jgi:large subunit ribosomal protein L18
MKPTIAEGIRVQVGAIRRARSRSNQRSDAQVIDDVTGTTLVAARALAPDRHGKIANGGTVEAATQAGTAIAKTCKSKGIDAVVYDRGGNLYHGRIKALADAARDAGLLV